MSRPGSVSKAGKPKLSYFPLNGRGALARLIFAAAGKKPNVDFIDEQIEVINIYKYEKFFLLGHLF